MVWKLCSGSGLYSDFSPVSSAAFPSSGYDPEEKKLPGRLQRKYLCLEKSRAKRRSSPGYPHGSVAAAFWQIRYPVRRLFLCYRRESPENPVSAFLLRKGSGNRLHRRAGLDPPLYSFPGIFRIPYRNFTPRSRRSSACSFSISQAFFSIFY